MSYATQAFLYTQRQIVIFPTGTSGRIYLPQYSKPLTLHRGVDNHLRFQFLNEQQKPVDLTDRYITFRMISADGTQVLLSKALTIQLALTGITVLELNAADIENINAQKAYYTLEITDGDLELPVYMDQNATARGDLYLVNSILPAFVPSANVTIPTGQPFPNLDSNNNISNVLPNANTYYSSVINTSDNPIITLQTSYHEFNGDVTILGSSIVDGDWYTISTNSYANTSNTYGYTFKGYHPYIKMEFTSNTGNVTNILVR